jgi:transposase InsO family protein
VFEVSRATVFRSRRQLELPFDPPKKRGPKTKLTDDRLLELIRDVLATSAFTGEGHRKVWARLRFADVRTSKRRVLRLMREHHLLAPTRAVRDLGPRNHDGTIVTSVPDTMWGTDLTSTFTLLDGWVSVFVAVDHCTAECVGIHASKRATRFEALDPIRQGVRARFGGYGPGVAAGLLVRHDNGSQYVSKVFQDELDLIGAESSPSFVRSPEGNGCAERFIRTLKEQLLWAQTFETVEDLRLALVAFKAVYNERWLIERLGHRTPAQARADLVAMRDAA